MIIKIGNFKKSLSDIITGFLYYYRRFGLAQDFHASQATHAEIKYFYDLGEMLGFWSEVEARSKNTEPPADLVWVNAYDEYYYHPKDLVLFMERETRGWEKIDDTAKKFFSKPWKVTVPMGIAILDNVPKGKIEETVKLFKAGFEKGKLYNEFALLIYQKMGSKEKTKPILVNIFTSGNGNKPKIETIQARFEYLGKYRGEEDSGFTIVSFDD